VNLSPHFSLAELTLSETAGRKGIDNNPGPEALANLRRLATVLEDVRTLAGKPINISSGFRAPAVNNAVGGASNSAHVQGLAADINVPGMTPAALARLIEGSSIRFDQLILEFDRWVHIGLSNTAPRGQLLTIRTSTGYMSGIV
jgi:zinc D-Ala-D-Ala carboxypeptidase